MTPETKVDASLKALELYYAQKDGCKRHSPMCGKICLECVAEALTLAQQAAYERAAQAVCVWCGNGVRRVDEYDHLDEDGVLHFCTATKIRALGSASALELALAQARLDEVEFWYGVVDLIDPAIYSRMDELRARIAALSGQEIAGSAGKDQSKIK